MPFNTGLSGLNAAAADLRVTGNNIANAGTTGFKESRAEFANIFSQSYGGGSKTIGSGVRLLSATQQFVQGNSESTQNPLDMAIEGQGFFVLKDIDGGTEYTRAGEFQINQDGYIVNAAGQRLQGFAPIDPSDIDTDFRIGNLSDIQLLTGDSQPKATTSIEAMVNLRSDAVEPTITPFAWPVLPETNPDPDSYNFSTSLTVYDSLGTPRTLNMYFVKTANPLEWEAYIGMENPDPAGGGEVIDVGGGAQPIIFDANGLLTTPAPGTFIAVATADPFPDNGAVGLTADLDFAGTTQFGASYTVNELGQDGYTTGRLSGIDIDKSGRVFARFSNGQSQALSQVALANFKNPQGLQQLGNNNWGEAFAAGNPLYGAPAIGDLGQIRSLAIEASNVDIAAQLVNLIIAQRNYQANAQTIATANTITQTILNIR